MASSAFDDVTSERVPDTDLGVLWGSPIMALIVAAAGIVRNPTAGASALAPAAAE